MATETRAERAFDYVGVFAAVLAALVVFVFALAVGSYCATLAISFADCEINPTSKRCVAIENRDRSGMNRWSP